MDNTCECEICKNRLPFEMPMEIVDAVTKGQLVLFAGAGISTENNRIFKETFSPGIVEKIMNKTTFVYTPKHASWLNIAEIEINMMSRECLSRNIRSKNEIINETSAWCDQNNLDKRKISWSFTKYKADKKLSKYYVS